MIPTLAASLAFTLLSAPLPDAPACVTAGICPTPAPASRAPHSGTMYLALGLVVVGAVGLARCRRGGAGLRSA